MFAFYMVFCSRFLARSWFYSETYAEEISNFEKKKLENLPDLRDALFTRIPPTRPASKDVHIEWKQHQKPVFYQYGPNATQYRLRKPRYVQWDGTMNMPILPFKNDQCTGVPNWTFSRNISN